MKLWKSMRRPQLCKGAVGYVSFLADGLTHSSQSLQVRVYVLCEVLDMKKKQIEITPVAGDGTCIWIDANKIHTQVIEG